ncbi:MAG TPA: hypothetical protein VF120_08525, partial [Ktedonobacterales bacterium]
LFAADASPAAMSQVTTVHTSGAPNVPDERATRQVTASIPGLDDSPFWNVRLVRETPLGDPALKQGKHPVSRYFERSSFALAREALHKAAAQGSGGIALFGPPMVGKTRLAHAALLREAPAYLLLPWPRHDFALSALSRFAGLPVALLLDDLHELGHQQGVGRIREAVQRLLSLTDRLLVVITSRSGADEALARQHYDGLIESLGLAVLRIAPMARDESEARLFLAFVRELARQEPARPLAMESFDGTPGSVLLGLERRTSQLRSSRFPSSAKAILKALALLRAAGVYDYPESRVRRVAAEVFELADWRWSEALDYLIGGGWVSLDEGDMRGESNLYVPSDAYLDVCLSESGVYPRSNRRVTSDFPKVCEALARAPVDSAALVALSRAISGARREISAKWTEVGLEAARAALAALDPVPEPVLWARGQQALGLSYWTRFAGDERENTLRAVAAFEAAETILTCEAYPAEWGAIQLSLGAAYGDGPLEPKDQLLERAFGCFQSALAVYTREAFPYNWARAHNNIALVLVKRSRGERASNVEQAISHFQLALQVITREAYPTSWAVVTRNLAETHAKREAGNTAENEELAVSCCQVVLDEAMRQTSPYDWARTHVVLGDIYQRRRSGERAANLRTAIAHYETALTVLIPGEYAVDHAQVSAARHAAREALARQVPLDPAGDMIVGCPPPDDPDAPDCS